jgi:hypothetical protein
LEATAKIRPYPAIELFEPIRQGTSAFPQTPVNWNHIIVADCSITMKSILEPDLPQNLFEIISADAGTNGLVAQRLGSLLTN